MSAFICIFVILKITLNMYLLKVKGNGNIPDYLQIRDQNFTLIAYFTIRNLEQGLSKNGLEKYQDLIQDMIDTTEYGRIIPLEK
jgi:hypothetical protein